MPLTCFEQTIVLDSCMICSGSVVLYKKDLSKDVTCLPLRGQFLIWTTRWPDTFGFHDFCRGRANLEDLGWWDESTQQSVITWTNSSWWNIIIIIIQHNSPRCCWNFWNWFFMIVVRCVRQLAKIIWQSSNHLRSRFYCTACKWKRNVTNLLAGISCWTAALCRSCLARWFCASWRLSGFGHLDAKSVGKVVMFGEGGLRDFSNQRYEEPRMMSCPNRMLKRRTELTYYYGPNANVASNNRD